MSQAREVRNKIGSIKNTQKITRAMELVAASKMRKAQDRVALSRPYSERIRQVISHVSASHSEYKHPYLEERTELKRVGLIAISTDRGLCGGLNLNLFRQSIKQMKEWNGQNIEIDVATIGHKGNVFFRSIGSNIVATADHLGDEPQVQDVIGIVKVLLDLFDEGKLDAIYVASNLFINTMVQKPQIKRLLPLPTSDQVSEGHWDYIYEPDSSKELLEKLLIRYIESQVYQAVVENVACEQSARMVAMKSATDNAGDLIKELQLVYNKARQAAITQEISEIVAGAAAVE